MSDLEALFREGAAAVKNLPPDLRPVAFRFILEQGVSRAQRPARRRAGRPSSASQEVKREPARKAAAASEPAPKVVDSLKVDVLELRGFVQGRPLRGHKQKYAVLAAFLKEQKIADRVGQDEMYTCYRALGWRAPHRMLKVFHDARRGKAWFSSRGDDGKFELTHIGEQAVEHDLVARGKEGE